MQWTDWSLTWSVAAYTLHKYLISKQYSCTLDLPFMKYSRQVNKKLYCMNHRCAKNSNLACFEHLRHRFFFLSHYVADLMRQEFSVVLLKIGFRNPSFKYRQMLLLYHRKSGKGQVSWFPQFKNVSAPFLHLEKVNRCHIFTRYMDNTK